MNITENELLKLKQALISLDDEATLVNQALEKSDGVVEGMEIGKEIGEEIGVVKGVEIGRLEVGRVRQ